jgi:hypothetical protein
MIQDRIAKIEATLSSTQSIPAETRDELLKLLADLKAEVAPLAETHARQAGDIAQFTDDAVQDAISSERQPEVTAEALKGLASSVSDFEASHPRLVQIVDRIALTLSNMGI